MLSRKHIALLAAALLLAGCANQPGATNAGQTSPGGTTQAAQAQASADTTGQATQAAQTTQEALTPTTETTQAHTTEAEAGGSETDETKAAGDQGAQPQPGETQPTDTKADAPASGDGQKTSEEQAANTQGGATIQTGDANFDPFFPTGASEEEAKLIKDEYDGLTFTASVNTRQAILPGSVFQVHLTVKNTGDQTVSYVKGSGSFTTPSALSVEVDGLQRVLPQDQLGVNTMDYVTLQLKPGEELRFVWNVRAMEPYEDFDGYTHDTYFRDQIYLGSIEWDDLKTLFPDFVAAKPGTYEGKAAFAYSTGTAGPFLGATGYAEATFTATVNEP